MIFDELRARGRAGAARVIGEVRRRLGNSHLVPDAVVPSVYTSPPEEFERPPPRNKTAPQRADGRAIGWREMSPTPLPKRTGARLIALYVTPTSEDWLRVAGARPQFEGHVQPRLPALGFYASDAVRSHIELAKQSGIDAFAFVVGDEPCALDVLLADPSIDFSFCVVWQGTNEARLKAALADQRWLRVDGRPAVMLRGERAVGIDAFVVTLPPPARGSRITVRQSFLNPAFRGEVFGPAPHVLSEWPVVSLAHDDEPRRPGAGLVELHDSPRAFRDRLHKALQTSAPFVILDAWNDWTRGAVLEPDARLGHAYLCATRDALHPPAPVKKPVVVVHAYYVELLDEIVDALKASALDARVIVTTTFEREAEVRAHLLSRGFAAEVEAHENRGRDILPFLRVANRLLDEGTELVLKLHTKSSGHRVDGAKWRAELIGRLVAPQRVQPILRAFATDSSLGCVGPEGHHLPLSVYWGWNEDNVRQLCVRMGVPEPDVAHDRFCAGSMFWARLSALRPLLDTHLGEWEFPVEGGYVDGTIAHAIERALGLSVQGARMSTRTAAAVCGIRFDDDALFAYAEPTGRLEEQGEP